MMNDFSNDIATRLLEIGAVKIQLDPPFTWTSGIKSPIYCDNRRLISYVDHRRAVVMAWKACIEQRVDEGMMKMPDVLGGTATAAIPWAAFLAYEMDLPMIYIRPEPKAHGAGKQIEGDLKPGQRVLIVEDLISTGGSSVKAAQAVREEGKGVVTDIFSIVTYGMQKSVDQFSDSNLNLTALTDFENLVGLAAKRGAFPKDRLSLVLEFQKDPTNWWGQFNASSS